MGHNTNHIAARAANIASDIAGEYAIQIQRLRRITPEQAEILTDKQVFQLGYLVGGTMSAVSELRNFLDSLDFKAPNPLGHGTGLG